LSALTKIFVVLVTLLAVALVAAIVPFVANTENWRQKFEDEQSARKIAQATASARQQQLNEERSDRQAENLVLDEKIKALEDQVVDQTGQLAAHRAEIARKDFDLETLRAADIQLRATNDSLARITESQTAELTLHRQNVREQAERLVGLNHRVAELTNDNDFLEQQLRYLKEQLVAVQDGRQELADLLEKIPPSARPVPQAEMVPTDPKVYIEGLVTRVENAADDTFVEVNVGATDGVEEGTRFFVQRGDQYVGTLIITRVEDRAAAGRMDVLKPDHQVTRGDVVTAHPPS